MIRKLEMDIKDSPSRTAIGGEDTLAYYTRIYQNLIRSATERWEEERQLRKLNWNHCQVTTRDHRRAIEESERAVGGKSQWYKSTVSVGASADGSNTLGRKARDHCKKLSNTKATLAVPEESSGASQFVQSTEKALTPHTRG